MESKTLLPLASVVLGWLLGQGGTILRERRSSKKLRKALLTELEDIREQLIRTRLTYARKIQMATAGCFEGTNSISISSYFFDNHYKDVIADLSASQRRSYQLIHESIRSFNLESSRFSESCRTTYQKLSNGLDKAAFSMEIQKWQGEIICNFKNLSDILWYINYHLMHPKNPELDILGPMHQSYVKYQEELDFEIKTIIEKAKSLKPEDFRKIYNESDFE